MARGFLYVYERIYKGETEMQTEFRKIPVNGKRTSVADQKRVRKIISDNAYRIAQECSVLVSYPKMRIEGTQSTWEMRTSCSRTAESSALKN